MYGPGALPLFWEMTLNIQEENPVDFFAVIYTRNFTRYCVRGDFKYIGCVKKVG
jgi:hypothetical protein